MMQKKTIPQWTRAVIFANGDLPDLERLRAWLRPEDMLIAADGGLRHISALGLIPHMVIGDLDSADPIELAVAEAAGCLVLRFPVEKDETDLELAINHALAQGFHTLRITAALGGRLDHTLGNLMILARPELAGLDLRLDDGCEEVWLAREQAEILGRPGDRVSLLPLGGPAEGITTEELRYPLRNETLYAEHSRGISNEMLEDRALVRFESGTLIVIHTRLR